MPITVTWRDADHTIILRTIQGSWTWQEFYESNTKIRELLAEVDHDVDQIIDLSQSSVLPTNALSQFASSAHSRETMTKIPRLWVVVGAGRMIEMLHKMLLAVMPQLRGQVRLVKTHAEALEVIQKYRQTLP